MTLTNFLIYGPPPQQVPDYGLEIEFADAVDRLDPEWLSKEWEPIQVAQSTRYVLGPLRMTYNIEEVKRNIALWTTKYREINILIGATIVVIGANVGVAVKYLAYRYLSVAITVTAFALLILSWIRSNQVKEQLNIWTIDPMKAVGVSRKAAVEIGFSYLMKHPHWSVHPTSGRIRYTDILLPSEIRYLYKREVKFLMESFKEVEQGKENVWIEKVIEKDLLSSEAIESAFPNDCPEKTALEPYVTFFQEWRAQYRDYNAWLCQEVGEKFESIKNMLKTQRDVARKVIDEKNAAYVEERGTQQIGAAPLYWNAIEVIDDYFEGQLQAIRKDEEVIKERVRGETPLSARELFNQGYYLFTDVYQICMNKEFNNNLAYEPLKYPTALNPSPIPNTPTFVNNKTYKEFMKSHPEKPPK